MNFDACYSFFDELCRRLFLAGEGGGLLRAARLTAAAFDGILI